MLCPQLTHDGGKVTWARRQMSFIVCWSWMYIFNCCLFPTISELTSAFLVHLTCVFYIVLVNLSVGVCCCWGVGVSEWKSFFFFLHLFKTHQQKRSWQKKKEEKNVCSHKVLVLQKENSLCRSFVCVDICVGSFNVHWLEYGVMTFCVWKVIYIFICVAYVFGLGSPTCLIHQTNVSYRSSQVFASKLAWKPDNKLLYIQSFWSPSLRVVAVKSEAGAAMVFIQKWSWSSDGVYPHFVVKN